MGNGEDTLMPYLNTWLLGGNINPLRARAIQEVEKQLHPVPNGPKEMQGSQNLFLLQAGSEMALHGDMTAPRIHELIVRLQRERDELGLWGSECTSPIYHHFTITGWSGIYHNTNNAELKELIEQNLGSFFWYALRMGLADSKHGLIGMRGTGHDFAESGFPDLHFVCQYFTSGRPKDYTKLESWKSYFKDSGWVMAGLPGGRSYDLYKKVFEYAVDDNWKPWKLRSKLTLVRATYKGSQKSPAVHFYERGINGNTPCLIGYAAPSSSDNRGGYLPSNCSVRIRQQQDNSSATMKIENDRVVVEYSGIYETLHGAPNNQSLKWGPLTFSYLNSNIKLEKMTSDLSGVSGWVEIFPSQSVPVGQPPTSTHIDPPITPPKKRKKWWEFWK